MVRKAFLKELRVSWPFATGQIWGRRAEQGGQAFIKYLPYAKNFTKSIYLVLTLTQEIGILFPF